MVFRNDPTPTGTSFLGYQDVAIVGFLDTSAEKKDNGLDWADVCIEVEVLPRDSEYSDKIEIIGSLEYESDGTLVHNSTLKKFYDLMDVLGCPDGFDIKGNFVQEDDTPITDIGAYLSAKYASTREHPEYSYLIYKYRKPAKPGAKRKDGQPRTFYTTAYPKLWKSGEEGRKDANGFITWMRNHKYLDEYTEQVTDYKNVQSAISAQTGNVPL